VKQIKKLIFRCDGASLPEIGTGHVVRDVAIANVLVEKGLCQPKEISFVTRRNGPFQVGYRLLKQMPFEIEEVDDRELEWNSLAEAKVLAGIESQVLIIDRLATEAKWMAMVANESRWSVVMDDTGQGAAIADIVINGILHDTLDGKGRYVGYDYLFLGQDKRRPYRKQNQQIKTIVASFGGHDNRNLTGFFLQSLLDNGFNQKDSIRLELLVGQESDTVLKRWREQIVLLRDQGWNEIELLVRTPNFYERLMNADLGIVSGGLTIFEAISAGVPVIGLPQYQHQYNTLKQLQKNHIIRLGSKEMRLDRPYFVGVLYSLLNAPDEQLLMAKRGTKLIDRKGNQRVFDILSPLLVSQKKNL